MSASFTLSRVLLHGYLNFAYNACPYHQSSSYIELPGSKPLLGVRMPHVAFLMEMGCGHAETGDMLLLFLLRSTVMRAARMPDYSVARLIDNHAKSFFLESCKGLSSCTHAKKMTLPFPICSFLPPSMYLLFSFPWTTMYTTLAIRSIPKTTPMGKFCCCLFSPFLSWSSSFFVLQPGFTYND